MFDPLRDVPLSAPVSPEEIADLTARCGGEVLQLASGERLTERDLGEILVVLLDG